MINTDEPIEFSCKHCGKTMLARPERAGRTIHCIRCHCAVRIPRQGAAVEVAPASRDAALGEAGETAYGIPAAFETQVVPAIREEPAHTEVVAWKFETAEEKRPRMKMTLSVRAGMLAAAVLIVGFAIAIKSTTGPRGAMATPTQPPVSSPGK